MRATQVPTGSSVSGASCLEGRRKTGGANVRFLSSERNDILDVNNSCSFSGRQHVWLGGRSGRLIGKGKMHSVWLYQGIPASSFLTGDTLSKKLAAEGTGSGFRVRCCGQGIEQNLTGRVRKASLPDDSTILRHFILAAPVIAALPAKLHGSFSEHYAHDISAEDGQDLAKQFELNGRRCDSSLKIKEEPYVGAGGYSGMHIRHSTPPSSLASMPLIWGLKSTRLQERGQLVVAASHHAGVQHHVGGPRHHHLGHGDRMRSDHLHRRREWVLSDKNEKDEDGDEDAANMKDEAFTLGLSPSLEDAKAGGPSIGELEAAGMESDSSSDSFFWSSPSSSPSPFPSISPSPSPTSSSSTSTFASPSSPTSPSPFPSTSASTFVSPSSPTSPSPATWPASEDHSQLHHPRTYNGLPQAQGNGSATGSATSSPSTSGLGSSPCVGSGTNGVLDSLTTGTKEPVYQVLEVMPDGCVREREVSRRQLLKSAGLRPRDIRRIDPSLWITNSLPAILVRDDIILLNLGTLRAVTTNESVLIFDHTSVGATMFLDSLLLKIKQDQANGGATLSFELEVLEAALISRTQRLEAALMKVEPRVKFLLQVLPNRLNADFLEELRISKQALVELGSKAGALRQMILELLEHGPDIRRIVMMGRNAKARLGKAPSSRIPMDERRLAEEEEEVELLLEYYLQRCDSVHGQAERLLDSAKEAEDSIAVNLSSRRLEVSKFELLLQVGTFCVAIGALVAGIFGMNLRSRLEDHAIAFWIATGTIVWGGIILFAVMLFYLMRRRIL